MLEGLAARGWRRVALMVVPDYAASHPLAEQDEFIAWLREKCAEGHEIWVHGLTHRAAWHESGANHGLAGWTARWVNRYLTQGESEFIGLSTVQQTERLRQALDCFQRIGFEVKGFTPPTWFGAVDSATLRACGLRYQDLRTGILNAQTETFLRAPALVWPSGQSAQGIWGGRPYLAWLRRATTLRYALHPGDARHADFWPTLEKLALDRVVCCTDEAMQHQETSPTLPGAESSYLEHRQPEHHWPTYPL
jgi:uncharacterized protein